MAKLIGWNHACCVHARRHAFMQTRARTHTYTHTHTHTCKHAPMCTYTCTHVHSHAQASPIADHLVFNKIKAKLGGRVRVIVSGGAPLPEEAEAFLRVSMCAPVVQVRGVYLGVRVPLYCVCSVGLAHTPYMGFPCTVYTVIDRICCISVYTVYREIWSHSKYFQEGSFCSS